MFKKVLVANRGAVAARVLRTLAEMKIPSVAVYSDADASAPYLALATETVRIGEGPARQSYLNQDRLIEVAQQTGCDALHPGYGFLAENAAFAQRLADVGVKFIGPSARWIAAMGHKAEARALAKEYGLPVARGSGVLPADPVIVIAAANAVGYPLMVKPAGGGGGIGMMPVRSETELLPAIERAGSLALRGFGNGEIYLEQLFENPRHVEIQVMGDQHGQVRHFFERDCSTQRRNQKIIEESGAPGISRTAARELADRVVASLQKMGYDNIGTVELLMAPDGTFTFLEMNTRLQVEHGVTEAVCGIDLVRMQIQVAAGARLAELMAGAPTHFGHAIEARVCAEDPQRFIPSPGRLDTYRFPSDASVLVETGYAEGNSVSPFYDSLLAKVIVHRPTREAAIADLILALEQTAIAGVSSNIPALLKILRSDAFASGRVHTGLVAEILKK